MNTSHQPDLLDCPVKLTIVSKNRTVVTTYEQDDDDDYAYPSGQRQYVEAIGFVGELPVFMVYISLIPLKYDDWTEIETLIKQKCELAWRMYDEQNS